MLGSLYLEFYKLSYEVPWILAYILWVNGLQLGSHKIYKIRRKNSESPWQVHLNQIQNKRMTIKKEKTRKSRQWQDLTYQILCSCPHIGLPVTWIQAVMNLMNTRFYVLGLEKNLFSWPLDSPLVSLPFICYAFKRWGIWRPAVYSLVVTSLLHLWFVSIWITFYLLSSFLWISDLSNGSERKWLMTHGQVLVY